MRKRTDSNQKKIVEALRKIGASVVITSDIGRGFPDLIVGFRGKTYLFEVKDENQYGKKLRKSQEDFKALWQGGEVFTIKNIIEAITVMEGK